MRAYIGEYEQFEVRLKKATEPTEPRSHLDDTRAGGSTDTVTDELKLRER